MRCFAERSDLFFPDYITLHMNFFGFFLFLVIVVVIVVIVDGNGDR